MKACRVTFASHNLDVQVPFGTLVLEAAQQAGLEIVVPCGGQGRCGRCAVIVANGLARRRSTLRLSPTDIESGYALACQTVIEGDATIVLLPPEKIERRLETDRTAVEQAIPPGYDPQRDQTVRAFYLEIEPPSLDDQTDDCARLELSLIHISEPTRPY